MGLTESFQHKQRVVDSGAKTDTGGVTVRVGEQSWVVGDGFTVSDAVRTVTTGGELRDVPRRRVKTGAFEPVRRPSLRDSFKMGLVFGLAMGCLGLVLFHQMPAISGATSANSVGAWPGNAAMSGPEVTIPAIDAYALSVGEYPDDTSARAAQSRLKHSGVMAVVYPAGQSRRRLVVQLAAQSADLSTEQNILRSHHLAPSTVHLTTTVRAIPTLSSTSLKDGERISSWLSAEMSAANTLMASLSDGEPVRDAQTATEKAVKLQPNAAVLGATGYGTALQALAEDVDRAEQLLAHHHNGQAQLDLIGAYSAMASLGSGS